MTLPNTYSWYPQGERLTIPYEAPQGRRVNAIGAIYTHGPAAGRFEFAVYATVPTSSKKKAPPSLATQAAAHGVDPAVVGPIDSERFVAFIWQVAGRPAIYPEDWQRERAVKIWIDNYSVHKSARVKAEMAAWKRAGIELCYLPSYSPELSAIEPIWQDLKHHRMTQRSYDQLGEMYGAVVDTMTQKAAQYWLAQQKTELFLRRAA